MHTPGVKIQEKNHPISKIQNYKDFNPMLLNNVQLSAHFPNYLFHPYIFFNEA